MDHYALVNRVACHWAPVISQMVLFPCTKNAFSKQLLTADKAPGKSTFIPLLLIVHSHSLCTFSVFLCTFFEKRLFASLNHQQIPQKLATRLKLVLASPRIIRLVSLCVRFCV